MLSELYDFSYFKKHISEFPQFNNNMVYDYFHTKKYWDKNGIEFLSYLNENKNKILMVTFKEVLETIVSSEMDLITFIFKHNPEYFNYLSNIDINYLINILKGLLNPSQVYPTVGFSNSLKTYEERLYILYIENVNDTPLFINQLTYLYRALYIHEKISTTIESLYKSNKNNNNNVQRSARLKEITEMFAFQPFLNRFFNLISEHRMDDQYTSLYNYFVDELIKKGSPYSPIGVKISYQGQNAKLQAGRMFDALEIQWDSQGHGMNMYSNIRQLKANGKKTSWVSNKSKFKYILKNWDKAIDIINNSSDPVIEPLRNLINNNTINYENLNGLLFKLCNCNHYILRAFELYVYLGMNNISINGNKNIHFVTSKSEDGTFLTPFYHLYHLIKKQAQPQRRPHRIPQRTQRRPQRTQRRPQGTQQIAQRTQRTQRAEAQRKPSRSRSTQREQNLHPVQNTKRTSNVNNKKAPYNLRSRKNFPPLPTK